MSPVVCAVVTGREDEAVDGKALLEQALAQSGLWDRLAEVATSRDRRPEHLRVMVLPDLVCVDRQDGAGTHPALVEHLVDLLAERGYSDVAVGATTGSESTWLENRDVRHVAAIAGYRRCTDGGTRYEIVDLSDDLVPVPFPVTSTLYGSSLGRRWVEADVRISFAKSRTHEEHGFALCLLNLLNALPLHDKLYHYRSRLKPWDVCLDVLRQTPPHFALIDAVVGSHGNWSSRAPRLIATGTVIASPDTLLADWVGALKMGADPHGSLVNAKALDEVGLPDDYDVVGDLAPYSGWQNPHPALLMAARRIGDSVEASRALASLTTRVNDELFPYRSRAVARANRVLAPVLAEAGESFALESVGLWLHGYAAAGVLGLDAWRTLFSKDQLHWQEVPLDLDLEAYVLSDYEDVAAYIEPLEQLIRSTPGDHSGLRWRYVDESVLFEFSRVFELPFDGFVQRVDICRAIEYMKDYIGGRRVPVAYDDLGRITHQAERNIYLTQPNYLVLYGGKVIDVTKLEHVQYSERMQKIVWRTIRSSNDSAEFDDGSVTFTDIGGAYTQVTVVARQKFTLPLFWQIVDLDRTPQLKDLLVGDAYFTFFDGTMANLEAAYHGREFRVGRPWELAPDADGNDGDLPARNELAEAVARVGALARNLVPFWQSLTDDERGGRLDALGFRHFDPPDSATAVGPLGTFVEELAAAILRDLGVAGDE